MVSFQCEGCGDVFTKKKLDPHRNQCHHASFTCIDCMTNFQGTTYRAHTSCISEAQKYQGALYREKRKPNGQPQNTPNTGKGRHAYVEDANTAEGGGEVALVDAPPHAPSPPPAVNVFDFLVEERETPRALPAPAPAEDDRQLSQRMPGAFEDDAMGFQARARGLADQAADYWHGPPQNGYSYGNGPLHHVEERYPSANDLHAAAAAAHPFTTPAPKATRSERDARARKAAHSHSNSKDASAPATTTAKTSTDKKRKRHQLEDLDLTNSRPGSEGLDTLMTDIPPPSAATLHTGLTGGLNRLLGARGMEFPPSPEWSGDSPMLVGGEVVSPVKRTKASRGAEGRDAASEGKEKERGRKERKTSGSGVTVITTTSKGDGNRGRELVRVRRRRRQRSRSRSESRDSDRGSGARKLKAIEYYARRRESVDPDTDQQLVRHRDAHHDGYANGYGGDAQQRAERFLSFVTKGPESEKGVSINKALKRYHRERHDMGDDELSKAEEEKELWKMLRVRRNERGEVVLIF
ncbi:hypothetical protein W97_05037 [Coniosporium apollinis CBS 100218]|uniref:Zinc finger C2H2 LYAR-type domain-containing protein n=1 Tax=Coniosporium apollinis (strain CBS 100218) TaxID=1168221 RepID=R7YVC2_CONA1|nr:uncharacterized protein W97_05037 [Coniosporium apollinis CBS 100218]EON65798.1 hypothetical protein W97_05037 [Coniosporium apollinis CBS 100218]